MLKKEKNRGDTLIEVLFSVATFSLVVVTCLALMNQGTSASIRSLQITLVRQEIDNQADTLRFLSDSYVAAYYKGYAPDIHDSQNSPAEEYYKILSGPMGDQVTKFGGTDGTTCPSAPASSGTSMGGFILDSHSAQYIAYAPTTMVAADAYPQVTYTSGGALDKTQGIWIEAAKTTPKKADGSVDDTKPAYIDFHIRACWYPSGVGTPMNLGTIVRLYVPTS